MFLKSIGAAIAALTLAAACGPQARTSLTPLEGDSFVGPADAKVTVIEYGAPTCPGCKAWHDQYWARFKADYVEARKVKFVFREFPSHNPPVDAAIFSIARCVGQGEWFAVIDKAFEKQTDIERASQRGDAKQAMIDLGKDFRLSPEQVESCISDPKNIGRVQQSQEEGFARGVHSTPTFFVNDEMVGGNTMDEIWAQTTAKLDALFAPVPAASAPAAPAAPPTETPATPPAQQ